MKILVCPYDVLLYKMVLWSAQWLVGTQTLFCYGCIFINNLNIWYQCTVKPNPSQSIHLLSSTLSSSCEPDFQQLESNSRKESLNNPVRINLLTAYWNSTVMWRVQLTDFIMKLTKSPTPYTSHVQDAEKWKTGKLATNWSIHFCNTTLLWLIRIG